jgi:hypothetical protein
MAVTEGVIQKGLVIAHLARPPAFATYTYAGTKITVAAGQTIKIETSPAGEELLEITVPAGKVWTISTRLDVFEEEE